MSKILDASGNAIKKDTKMTGEAAVKAVHAFISASLEEIKTILPPDYKVSFLARHTNMPEGQNADIFISEEQPADVMTACRRLIIDGAKPTFEGETTDEKDNSPQRTAKSKTDGQA